MYCIKRNQCKRFLNDRSLTHHDLRLVFLRQMIKKFGNFGPNGRKFKVFGRFDQGAYDQI